MKKRWLVLMFATLSFAQSAPVQRTNIPPKPTCNVAALPLFGGGPDCQDRWNVYNQAVQQRTRGEIQLYVTRQKELASQQATAPLQQQIADLNKLISDQQTQIAKLQQQMQADSAAAIQARDAAHSAGLRDGAGLGLGGALLLLLVIFGIKRLTGTFTITKRAVA
jgi:hypothetical protein